MVGLGLTQIGEFSYVLVQVARDSRLVGDDMYNATLAASVITILLNGILLRYLPRLLGEARGHKLSSAQAP
jgi:CPA2 family monovalent cation:H+ antiporter-2